MFFFHRQQHGPLSGRALLRLGPGPPESALFLPRGATAFPVPPLFPRHRRRRPPGLLDPAPAWEPLESGRGCRSCPRLPAPSVPAGAHLPGRFPACSGTLCGPCPPGFPLPSPGGWRKPGLRSFSLPREGPFFPPDCLPSGPAVPLAGGSHLLRRRLHQAQGLPFGAPVPSPAHAMGPPPFGRQSLPVYHLPGHVGVLRAPLFHSLSGALYPLRTSAPAAGRPNAIRYFGNLGLGRWRQLAAIGRALRAWPCRAFPQRLKFTPGRTAAAFCHI